MDQLVYEHEGRRVAIPLQGRPVSLGRSPEADHQLPSKLASRIHAQVIPRGGAWLVEDLHSSNGTFVNGVKVNAPEQLRPGDVIVIADVRLNFEGSPPRASENTLARLVYPHAPGAPPVETIIHGKVTIGRKPPNTLVIDHKAVSSKHCEIERRGDEYFVRDLGSSNGTYIGETPVSEGRLRNGDVLIIGKAVKVFFIDPAAQAAAGTPAQPQALAPAPLAQGFEPVSAMKQRPVGPSPLPHIAAGVAVAALFVVAGWLVAGLIEEGRAPQPPAAKAPALAAAGVYSFEGLVDGGGNPEGWVASFEAPNNATAELYSDSKQPVDGERSLSVTTRDLGGAAATLVLQTVEEQRLGFGGSLRAGLHVRGEGVSNAALALSIIDDSENVRTLACTRIQDVKSTQWTVYTFSATLLEPLPSAARVRLVLCGNFGRVWLDRFELEQGEDAEPVTPFIALAAGAISVRADAQAGGLLLRGAADIAARALPRLLDAEDRELSDPELWSIAHTTPGSASFRTLLPRRGELRALELRAFAQEAPLIADRGARLVWRLAERGGSNFALQISLHFPRGSAITVADRNGAPLQIGAGAVHAFAYATIGEISVPHSGMSFVFPQGAVAWIDFSGIDELALTLRSAPESSRDGLIMEVYARPLMHARLYERVYADGLRWMDDRVRNYSAALARLEWLTDAAREFRDLPVVARARDRVKAIEELRLSLRAQVDKAWQAAKTDRTRANLDACHALLSRYREQFSSDPVCAEFALNLAQVEAWQREQAMVARTPEEMQRSEAAARGLYDDADAMFKKKNYLVALILAENVMRDYADTQAMRDARALYDAIQKLLSDPALRDKEIDARMADIDQDIKNRRWAVARNMCLDLFKRFPDTPRGREIMQRLRAIESAYE